MTALLGSTVHCNSQFSEHFSEPLSHMRLVIDLLLPYMYM